MFEIGIPTGKLSVVYQVVYGIPLSPIKHTCFIPFIYSLKFTEVNKKEILS